MRLAGIEAERGRQGMRDEATASGPAPILEVRGLTKRFGGLVAVNDVSFTVEEGQIFTVIGPNGAGKSTLFKLITSALRPTAGQVIFRGEDITGLRPHIVAKRGVVRTFQETTVFRDMTVHQAIATAHHLRGEAGLLGIFLDSAAARRDARAIEASTGEILALLELREVAHERSRNLPQGYLRALGIAMALAARPALLLLDEPFAGMNAVETDRMVDIVRRIREQKIGIMLVEHDMPAVMRISDRIAVISFGRKIDEGTPDEIKESKAVIDAYLGEEDEELGI